MSASSPNPKYRDFPKSRLTVHSSHGEYSFVCQEVRRGTGKDSLILNAYGIGPEPDLSDSQFWFDFGGQTYGAELEIMGRFSSGCRVRMFTIVNDPKFWE